MNRNSENHFAYAPTVDLPRSTFHIPKNIKTTFNAGLLIPFYLDQNVLPGDTYRVNGNFVVRMSTPINPTMDNLIFDTYFFYVPYRITWQHWKEFMGENTSGSWTQTVQYSIPQIKFGRFESAPFKIEKGDIADYLGLPLFNPTQITGTSNYTEIKVSRLPFTGYVMCWNEYFRNQNLEAPVHQYIGDQDVTCEYTGSVYAADWHATNATSNWSQYHTFRTKPAPVNKTADYFTTCNPSPQKGAPVSLGIPAQTATVNINADPDNDLTVTDGTNTANLYNVKVNANEWYIGTSSDGTTSNLTPAAKVNYSAGLIGTADLSNLVGATINAQRLSFATQRILERDTFGTRWREVLHNHWHISNADVEARIQIPEYLGGKRQALQMTQTVQNSETGTTPLGTTGAFSLTVASDRLFTKSFVEHGCILGLCTVRVYRQSYSQGIERAWSRKEKLDFYWPELAHLGEQAVLQKEIYATGDPSEDNKVFGYQERWAEYKYNTDITTGAMRPTYAQTLDSWHYGTLFANAPVLSGEFSNEDKNVIDRTLAVTSAAEDQFIMDCWLDITKSSCQPVYSLPGLIDHY